MGSTAVSPRSLSKAIALAAATYGVEDVLFSGGVYVKSDHPRAYRKRIKPQASSPALYKNHATRPTMLPENALLGIETMT